MTNLYDWTAFAFAAFAALAFLRFATSFAFAAAESFRLGFAGSGVAVSEAPRTFAQRSRCASLIRFRAAAENTRRFRPGACSAAAFSPEPPDSMARSSVILASMLAFWISKPSMAAVMISAVSLVLGTSAFRNHPR